MFGGMIGGVRGLKSEPFGRGQSGCAATLVEKIYILKMTRGSEEWRLSASTAEGRGGRRSL